MTLRPSKDYQIVVEKKADPETNVTASSDIWLIPGDDEMVQHIILINKPGPQYIFISLEKEMSSNMYTRNHA